MMSVHTSGTRCRARHSSQGIPRLSMCLMRECSFYKCDRDIEGLHSTQRYCEDHAAVHGHKCAFWVAHPPCGNNHEDNRLTCTAHKAQEDEFNRRNREATWTAAQRARFLDQEPEDMRMLRAILGRKSSWGSLSASWSCGIICGIVPLLEAEGCVDVDAALNQIFPHEDRRPTILFYDKACVLDRYLSGRGDLSWDGTMVIVDRFHYRGHTELACSILNNPNDYNNRLLWNLQQDPPEFYWNSSIAESNNGWLSGFRHVLMRMPKVLNRFVLDNNICFKNELLLVKKLLSQHPTFDR